MARALAYDLARDTYRLGIPGRTSAELPTSRERAASGAL